MRADRLLEILLLLQNHSRLRAADLAERLEVSVRTVYRDLDALSSAGIPVVTETGPHGGVSLMEGYRTRLTGLSQPEVEALASLPVPRSLADLGLSHSLQTGLLKLAASLPASQRDIAAEARKRLHIDNSGWFVRHDEVPHLELIHEAVWSDRRIEIEYQSPDRWSRRAVAPWALVLKGERWYLVAESKGEPRTFRVSRILEARLLDETFERPDDFDLPGFWDRWYARFLDQLPSYQVKLRTTAQGRTELARNGWQTTEIERDGAHGDVAHADGAHGDGDPGDGAHGDRDQIVLIADLQRQSIAANVVFTMQSPCAVLEPESLRRTLRGRADKILSETPATGA